MATAAERKAIPPVPKEEEVSFERTPLGAELVKTLTPQDYALMQLISVAIGKDGLTLDEALILNNIDATHFKTLMEKHPVIAKVIRYKETEYKRSLIKTLSHRARNGDDDVAMTLLAQRFPDEFGKNRNPGDTAKDDVLLEGIRFIQEHGDAEEIIRRRKTYSAQSHMPAAAAPATPATGSNPLTRALQSFLT